MAIRDGRVVFQGTRPEFSRTEQFKRLFDRGDPPRLTLPTSGNPPQTPSPAVTDILIDMKNITVHYSGTVVLEHLNWSMKAGQNWVILGPNGSGKTTLLNLISGDNLQAYANNIRLFGKLRGSGESIWEIKERIGMISSEFQIRYRKNMSALDVVLSGYFDSVGLYRSASARQRQAAEQWLMDLGIDGMSDRIFNRLSYGEQRMVLIARAMVKIPQILILDEPYQGLDRTNRQRILAAIDVIGQHPRTNLIYVTHYPDELPACSTHMLEFEAKPEGGFSVCQRVLTS
jgi:molybdate transport system ATP-binding protein